MLSVRPVLIANAPSTAATNYTSIGYTVGATWNATETSVQTPMPILSAITNFRVDLTTAPGATKSWTFTVRKNGVDTACSVTISDTATFGTYEGDAVVFQPGDLFSVSCTPTNTPTSTISNAFSFVLKSGAHKSFIMGGTSNNMTSATPFYHISGYTSTIMTTLASPTYAMPSPGKLSRLFVFMETPPGGAATRTFRIYKNGVATALVVTLTGATAAGSVEADVEFDAGDYIVIGQTGAGGPAASTACGWGLELNPDIDGETMVFSRGVNASNVANRFTGLAGLNGASSAGSVDALSQYGVVGKKLWAVLGDPPGTGASYTVSFVKSGVAQPVTCTISDTATLASDLINNFTTNLDDNLCYIITPTNTPVVSSFYGFSSVLYIPPIYTKIY